MRKRRLTYPWPFLLSVDEKRGLVENVQPPPPKIKRTRLKKIPPSNTWTQDNLL